MRLSGWLDHWILRLHQRTKRQPIHRRPRPQGVRAAELLEVRELLSNLVVANNSYTVTNIGTAQMFDVLANDSDSQGGVIRLHAVTAPSHGSAVIVPGVGGQRDRVQYTPTAGYVGSDTFNYTARAVDDVLKTAKVTVTLKAPAGGGGSASPPTLANLRLVNDTGIANDKITTDARVAGTLVATAGLTGLSVQFDFDGNATVDASTTQVNPDGTFTFDVANPGGGVAGISYGTVDLKVRPVQTVSGQVLTGAWQTLAFTYQQPPPPTPSIDGLRLVNDTRFPNDRVTSDARITGGVLFSGSLTGLTIQADTDSNGTADFTTATGVDGQFQLDVARIGTTGPGITYGPATIRVRAGSGTNFGVWTQLAFTFEAPPVRPSVTQLALVSDTGDPTDRVTTDPRITATLSNSDGTILGLSVQVDYNGDGISEATATTDSAGRFELNPSTAQWQTPPLEFGSHTLRVRGGEWDSFTNRFEYGEWVALQFNYTQAPTPSQVINLHLAQDTGTAGDGMTADATIVGSLTAISGAAGLVVEYDYNGDGLPEVTAPPNSDGSFLLDLGTAHGAVPAISHGNVTVSVRAGKDQAGSSEKLYGNWQTVSFLYAQFPAGGAGNSSFYIDQLRLLNDTDIANDRITRDSRLTGYVLGTGDLSDVTMEVDLAGNGTVDATLPATAVATFELDPRRLGTPSGPTSVFVRAMRTAAGGLVERSEWKGLSFTLSAPPPAIVQSLVLVADTGTAGDQITAIPKVAGVATADGTPLATVAIQYAVGASDQPQDTVYTGNDGTFEVDLDAAGDLVPGPITLKLRTVTTPAGLDSVVVGDWQQFAFTYEHTRTPAPLVAELRLVCDTGAAGDFETTDPRATGRLTNNGATLERLPVQYDFDGDELPEGTVRTDSAGWFVIDPRNAFVSEGDIALRVRSLVFDETYLEWVIGDWTTFDYHYTWAPPSPPAVEQLALVIDDGSSSTDRITSVASVTGLLVSSDSSVANVAVEFDTNGDGVSEGEVYSNVDGEFVIDAANDLTPGPVAVAVRSGVWNERTGDLEYGVWNPITFTWTPPLESIPDVTGLALLHDTDVPNDLTTADPRVAGQITREHGGLADVGVEFDLDLDDLADGAAAVNPTTGSFVLDLSPNELVEAVIPLRVRAVARGSVTGELLIGPWRDRQFTLQFPSLNLSPPSDLVATQLPIGLRLDGIVTRPPGLDGPLTIEYRLVNADSLLGSTILLPGSTNFFAAIDRDLIPPEASSVEVRVSAFDDNRRQTITSDWTTVSFSTASASVPLTVTSLDLLNDTGTAGDHSTSDPRIRGAVIGSGLLDNLPIEYDLDDDGVPDGFVNTDDSGTGAFVLDLRNADLAPGLVTLQVRAGGWNEVDAGYDYGDWTDFAFTYVPHATDAPAEIASFTVTRVAADSEIPVEYGIASLSQGKVRISGQVSRVSGSTASLPVEYDLDGDGQAEGYVAASVSGDGTFTVDINATSVPTGSATIGVRAGSFDVNRGKLATSPWSTQQFQNDPSAGLATAPSIPVYLGMLGVLPSAGLPTSYENAASFGASEFYRSVQRAGAAGAMAADFLVPVVSTGVAPPEGSLGQLGAIDFRAFERLADPFAAPATATNSSVPSTSDTTSLASDGLGGLWTVRTVLESTLTTVATLSAAGWTRTITLTSQYTITSTGGSGSTRSQTGFRDYVFSATATASTVTYGYAERQFDSFASNRSSSDATSSTRLTGSGVQAGLVAAVGTKTLGSGGSFTATETFEYVAGSYSTDRDLPLSTGVLPTFSAGEEVFDYTHWNGSSSPATSTRQDRTHFWNFGTEVTIASSNSAILGTVTDQIWSANDTNIRQARFQQGDDSREQTTTDHSHTSFGPAANSQPTLAWSQQQTTQGRRTFGWTGAAGGVATAIDTLNSVQHDGSQSITSGGSVQGHFSRTSSQTAVTTVNATYSLGPLSIDQERITTLTTGDTTTLDHSGGAVSGGSTSSRSVSIDTVTSSVRSLDNTGVNGGVTFSQTGTEARQTHAINQYFHTASTPYGAVAATATTEATVDRTDTSWNSNTSASAQGLLVSGSGTTLFAISRSGSDTGSTTHTRVSNSVIGTGASLQVPGYLSLTPNSVLITGSGGGETTWNSTTMVNATISGIMQPGVTISTQQTSTSSDLGSGTYSTSFDETTISDSNGSPLTNGSFASSKNYSGQLMFQDSSTVQISGQMSPARGQSARVMSTRTSSLTGAELYHGSLTGTGGADASGTDLSISGSSLISNNYTFNNGSTESIKTSGRGPGASQSSHQSTTSASTGAGAASIVMQLIGTYTNSSPNFLKTTTETSQVHGDTTSSMTSSATSQIAGADDTTVASMSGSTSSSRTSQGTFTESSLATTTETPQGTARESSSTTSEQGTYTHSHASQSTSSSIAIDDNRFRAASNSSSTSRSGAGSYLGSETTLSTASSQSTTTSSSFSESGDVSTVTASTTEEASGIPSGLVPSVSPGAMTMTPGPGLSSSYLKASSVTTDDGQYSSSGSSLSERLGTSSSSHETGQESSSGNTTSQGTTVSAHGSFMSNPGFLMLTDETSGSCFQEHGTYVAASSRESTSGGGGTSSSSHSSASRNVTGSTSSSGTTRQIRSFDSPPTGPAGVAIGTSSSTSDSDTTWTGGSSYTSQSQNERHTLDAESSGAANGESSSTGWRTAATTSSSLSSSRVPSPAGEHYGLRKTRETHDIQSTTATTFSSTNSTGSIFSGSTSEFWSSGSSISDSVTDATDDYTSFDFSRQSSGSTSSQTTSFNEAGRDVSRTITHGRTAETAGTLGDSYNSLDDSQSSGTITFDRLTWRESLASREPEPGITVRQKSTSTTTISDGQTNYSSQTSEQETHSGQDRTQTSTDQTASIETGNIKSVTSSSVKITGTAAKEIDGLNHEIDYDDKTTGLSRREGVYTSSTQSTTSAAKSQESGATPTGSVAGTSASTWSEEGTSTGSSRSSQRHTIRQSGAAVGLDRSASGNVYEGTYDTTDSSVSTFGSGIRQFENNTTDSESRSSMSFSFNTRRLNSVVKARSSSGSNSSSTTTTTLDVQNSNAGRLESSSETGTEESTSWSSSHAMKKTASSEISQNDSDLTESSGTWNLNVAMQFDAAGVFVDSTADESYSGSAHSNFSSSKSGFQEATVGMIGSTRTYRLRSSENAWGTLTLQQSGDLRSVKTATDPDEVTTGTETSTRSIDGGSVKSSLETRGKRVDLSGGGTSEFEYGTGETTFNTIVSGGTLTTLRNDDGTRSTDGTVHVDATSLPMSVRAVIVTERQPLASGPSDITDAATGVTTTTVTTGEETTIDWHQSMTGQATRSWGTVTFAGSSSTPDIERSETDIESHVGSHLNSTRTRSTVSTSDGFETISDFTQTVTRTDQTTTFGTSLSTLEMIAATGTYGIVIAVSWPVQIEFSHTETEETHETVQERKTGEDAFERSRQSDSWKSTVQGFAARGTLANPNIEFRTDAKYEKSISDNSTTGSLGDSQSHDESQQYWKIVSRDGNDQVLTAWGNSWGSSYASTATSETAGRSRGGMLQSARRDTTGTAPVLTALNSYSENFQERLTVDTGSFSVHTVYTTLFFSQEMHLDGSQLVLTLTNYSTLDDVTWVRVNTGGPPGYNYSYSNERHENSGGPMTISVDATAGSWFVGDFTPNSLSLGDALAAWATTEADLLVGWAQDFDQDVMYFGQSLAIGIAGLADSIWNAASNFGSELQHIGDLSAASGEDVVDIAISRWIVQPIGGILRGIVDAFESGNIVDIISKVTDITQWIDPTPVSDILNAGAEAAKGNYGQALFSLGMAMIPFVGGGVGKLGKNAMGEMAEAGGKLSKGFDELSSLTRAEVRGMEDGMRMHPLCTIADDGCFVYDTLVVCGYADDGSVVGAAEVPDGDTAEVTDDVAGSESFGWFIAAAGAGALLLALPESPRSRGRRRSRRARRAVGERSGNSRSVPPRDFPIDPTDVESPAAKGEDPYSVFSQPKSASAARSMSATPKPIFEFSRPLRLISAPPPARHTASASRAASAPGFFGAASSWGNHSCPTRSGSRLSVPPRAGGAITTSVLLLLGILALAIGGWRTSRDLERATGRELAATPGGSPAVTTQPGPPSVVAPPVSAGIPKYRTRPIGEMRTGQRVLARNPQLDPAEVVSSEIDPATWRNVRLRMQKSTGGQLDIVLLRPVDWLQENGIDELRFLAQGSGLEPPSRGFAISAIAGELPAANLWTWHSVTRATSHRRSAVAHLFASNDTETPGNYRSVAIEGSPQRDPDGNFVADRAAPMHPVPAQLLTTEPQSSSPNEPPSQHWIFLDLPEIGTCGPAEVLAIEHCPEIEPGLGEVVTGTFAHSAAKLIDVEIEGLAKPIGCTANHPFWSEDQRDFVPAGTLQPGEHLRTESGTLLQVTRIRPRRGPPAEVFNLEVDAQHVYAVSDSAFVVHNTCDYVDTPWGRRDAKTGKFTTGERTGMNPVDDFIRHAEADGFEVLGREVTVSTPRGDRVLDVVLRRNGNVTGVEIKSSPAEFLRDRAGQRLKDRWIQAFGGKIIGKRLSDSRLTIIDDVVRIMWE